MSKLFNSTMKAMEEDDRENTILDQGSIEDSNNIRRDPSNIEDATPEELSSLIIGDMLSLLEKDLEQIFSKSE